MAAASSTATTRAARSPIRRTSERIRELGIPPAWKDVWICPDPRGHLQATGTDAAGRKQYLYHDAWRTRRDAEKFDDMVRFAHALPALRDHVEARLDGDELSRERVLACAVRLLDRGFFRIGSEQYAVENQSYGLATMCKEHVTISGTTRWCSTTRPRAASAACRRSWTRRWRRSSPRSSAAAAAARSCWRSRRAGAGATCARTTSTRT